MKKLIFILYLCSSVVHASSFVEVLHFWSSGSEAEALKVLKKELQKQDVEWKDLTIEGAAGSNLQKYLMVLASFDNLPTAVTMHGTEISEWASKDIMVNLNSVAEEGGWNDIVPSALKKYSKYNGQWVASPAGIHKTNWIWANKNIFDKVGIDIPKTFYEMMEAAKLIEKSGYIAFAGGGQAWQEVIIFENAVISTGGISLYRKAFSELDYSSINSIAMASAFEQLREIRKKVDSGYPGRDWSKATEMVIKGEAAMQIMGDWAKGEFKHNGKVFNEDYLCFPYPGTEGSFIFNSDQFAMFDVSKEQQTAQKIMAKTIMSPSFQAKFNQLKGSIPANRLVNNEGFDACSKKSMNNLKQAIEQDTMVGSIALGHMVSNEIKSAIFMTVGEFMNSNISAQDAAKLLADSIAFLK